MQMMSLHRGDAPYGQRETVDMSAPEAQKQ